MKFEKVFEGDGTTFSAKWEAEKWLTANGYSYGSSCAMHPQGILKGDYSIAKYRNLTKKERSQLDGLLYADREGSARVILKEIPASERKLPDDVREALLSNAKSWILDNYFGGQKRLNAFNDHFASLVQIRSYNFEGDRHKSLRRLAKLVKDGLLIEVPRYRDGVGTRSFTVDRAQLEEIGQEAIKYWESVGYVVGQMMDEIKPKNQDY